MEREGSNQPAGGAAWRSPEPPCARAPPAVSGAASPLAFWGRFGTEGDFCLGSLCRRSQGAAWLEAAVPSLGTPRPPAMEPEQKPFAGDPQGEGRRGVPGPHGAGELWDPRAGCPCLLPPGPSLLGGFVGEDPRWAARSCWGGRCPGLGGAGGLHSPWGRFCPLRAQPSTMEHVAALLGHQLLSHPENPNLAFSSPGKGWAGVKHEVVVKTEPEDESAIGYPQHPGARAATPGIPSVPSVPSVPSTSK